MMGQNTMTQQKLNALLKEYNRAISAARQRTIFLSCKNDPSLFGACLTTDTELCLTAEHLIIPLVFRVL